MKNLFVLMMAAALSTGLTSCSPEECDESDFFTVTWDLNYDGAPKLRTETAEEGYVSAAPESALREGYTCLGWFIDRECRTPYIFNTAPLTEDITLYAKWIESRCFRFKGPESFSIAATKGWDGILEYSTDAETWETWDGLSVDAQKIYDSFYLFLRGKNNKEITGGSSWKWTIEKASAECCGNIMTLLDYENPDSADMNPRCFSFMFFKCTGLTSAPELPALTLSDYCYYAMFSGCTGLASAPELPAETMKEWCYARMFEDCTKLTSAPDLSAGTMAAHCYDEMFRNCTGLTSAPALPAENLADNCYSSMFYGCTALTAAPELNAENLAASCYSSMFYECTKLTSVPGLPAAVLTEGCYYCMFCGCTSLTSAPKLSAESLTSNCYRRMFKNCSALKVNSTGKGTCFLNMPRNIPSYAVTDMFYGTSGDYASDPEAEKSYYYE